MISFSYLSSRKRVNYKSFLFFATLKKLNIKFFRVFLAKHLVRFIMKRESNLRFSNFLM